MPQYGDTTLGMKDKVALPNPLPPKQQAFVDEFVRDFRPTAAVKRAGYNHKKAAQTARRLLEDQRVRVAIDARITERSQRAEVTEQYIITTIQETIERCRQVEPVLDRNGTPVLVKTPQGLLRAAFTFNASGVYDGIRLLGKHQGMFNDAVQHKHSGNVNVIIKKFAEPEPQDITPHPPLIEAEKETVV